MSKVLRYLRIAFSATCIILCAVLINQKNDAVSSDLFPAYWCLVAAVAVFGVLPWFQWSKRFSLRTLLIVMTFIAVVLGLIVWAVR